MDMANQMLTLKKGVMLDQPKFYSTCRTFEHQTNYEHYIFVTPHHFCFIILNMKVIRTQYYYLSKFKLWKLYYAIIFPIKFVVVWDACLFRTI